MDIRPGTASVTENDAISLEDSQSSEQYSLCCGSSEVFTDSELNQDTLLASSVPEDRQLSSPQVRANVSKETKIGGTACGGHGPPNKASLMRRKSSSMIPVASWNSSWFLPKPVQQKAAIASSHSSQNSRLPVLVRSASVSAVHLLGNPRPATPPHGSTRPASIASFSRARTPEPLTACSSQVPSREVALDFWLKEKQRLEEALKVAQDRALTLEHEKERLRTSLDGASAKAEDLEFRVLELESLNESLNNKIRSLSFRSMRDGLDVSGCSSIDRTPRMQQRGGSSQDESWSVSGCETHEASDMIERYEQAVLEQLRHELEHGDDEDSDDSRDEKSDTVVSSVSRQREPFGAAGPSASASHAAPLRAEAPASSMQQCEAATPPVSSRKVPSVGDSARIEDLRIVLAMQMENESLAREQLLLAEKQLSCRPSAGVDKAPAAATDVASDRSVSDSNGLSTENGEPIARQQPTEAATSAKSELASRNTELAARLSALEALREGDSVVKLDLLKQLHGMQEKLETLLEERERAREREHVLVESLREAEQAQLELSERLVRYQRATRRHPAAGGRESQPTSGNFSAALSSPREAAAAAELRTGKQSSLSSLPPSLRQPDDENLLDAVERLQEEVDRWAARARDSERLRLEAEAQAANARSAEATLAARLEQFREERAGAERELLERLREHERAQNEAEKRERDLAQLLSAAVDRCSEFEQQCDRKNVGDSVTAAAARASTERERQLVEKLEAADSRLALRELELLQQLRAAEHESALLENDLLERLRAAEASAVEAAARSEAAAAQLHSERQLSAERLRAAEMQAAEREREVLAAAATTELGLLQRLEAAEAAAAERERQLLADRLRAANDEALHFERHKLLEQLQTAAEKERELTEHLKSTAEVKERDLAARLAVTKAAAENRERELTERLEAVSTKERELMKRLEAASMKERELTERLAVTERTAESKQCELTERFEAAAEKERKLTERLAVTEEAAESKLRELTKSLKAAAEAKERELTERLEAAAAKERELTERLAMTEEAAESKRRALTERLAAAAEKERELTERFAVTEVAAVSKHRELTERLEAAAEAKERELTERLTAAAENERQLTERLAVTEEAAESKLRELTESLKAAAEAKERELTKRLTAATAKERELTEHLAVTEAAAASKQRELTERLDVAAAKECDLTLRLDAMEAQAEARLHELTICLSSAADAKERELKDCLEALEAKERELMERLTAVEGEKCEMRHRLEEAEIKTHELAERLTITEAAAESKQRELTEHLEAAAEAKERAATQRLAAAVAAAETTAELKRRELTDRLEAASEVTMRELTGRLEAAKTTEVDLKQRLSETAARERHLKEQLEATEEAKERELTQRLAEAEEAAETRRRALTKRLEAALEAKERELAEFAEAAGARESELTHRLATTESAARERERELAERLEKAAAMERETAERLQAAATSNERELTEHLEAAALKERELTARLAMVEVAADERRREMSERLQEAATEKERELAKHFEAAEAAVRELTFRLSEAESKERELSERLAAAETIGEARLSELTERVETVAAVKERQLTERLAMNEETSRAKVRELTECLQVAEEKESELARQLTIAAATAEQRQREMTERLAAAEVNERELAERLAAAAMKERQLADHLAACSASAEATQRVLTERLQEIEMKERELTEQLTAAVAAEQVRGLELSAYREAAEAKERQLMERLAAAEAATKSNQSEPTQRYTLSSVSAIQTPSIQADLRGLEAVEAAAAAAAVGVASATSRASWSEMELSDDSAHGGLMAQPDEEPTADGTERREGRQRRRQPPLLPVHSTSDAAEDPREAASRDARARELAAARSHADESVQRAATLERQLADALQAHERREQELLKQLGEADAAGSVLEGQLRDLAMRLSRAEIELAACRRAAEQPERPQAAGENGCCRDWSSSGRAEIAEFDQGWHDLSRTGSTAVESAPDGRCTCSRRNVERRRRDTAVQADELTTAGAARGLLQPSVRASLPSQASVDEKHVGEESEKPAMVSAGSEADSSSGDQSMVVKRLLIDLSGCRQELSNTRSKLDKALSEAESLRSALAAATSAGVVQSASAHVGERASISGLQPGMSHTLPSPHAARRHLTGEARQDDEFTEQQQQPMASAIEREKQNTAELREKIRALLQTEETMIKRVVQLTSREAELLKALEEAGERAERLQRAADATARRQRELVARVQQVRDLLFESEGKCSSGSCAANSVALRVANKAVDAAVRLLENPDEASEDDAKDDDYLLGSVAKNTVADPTEASSAHGTCFDDVDSSPTPPQPTLSLRMRLKQKMASLSWLPDEDDDRDDIGAGSDTSRSQMASLANVAHADRPSPTTQPAATSPKSKSASSMQFLGSHLQPIDLAPGQRSVHSTNVQEQPVVRSTDAYTQTIAWQPSWSDELKAARSPPKREVDEEAETMVVANDATVEATTASQLSSFGSLQSQIHATSNIRPVLSIAKEYQSGCNGPADDIEAVRQQLADKDLQLTFLREAVENVISNISLVPEDLVAYLHPLQSTPLKETFRENFKSIIRSESSLRKKSSILEIELKGLRASEEVKGKEYAARIRQLETAVMELSVHQTRVGELELQVLHLQRQADELSACLLDRDGEIDRLLSALRRTEQDRDGVRQQLAATVATELGGSPFAASGAWTDYSDSPAPSPRRDGCTSNNSISKSALQEVRLQMEVAQLEEQVRVLLSKEAKLEQLTLKMQSGSHVGDEEQEELRARISTLERSERALLRKIEMLECNAAASAAQSLDITFDRPEGVLRQRIHDLEQMERHLRNQVSDLEHDREELHEIARSDKSTIHELNVAVAELTLANGTLKTQISRLEMTESSLTTKLEYAESRIEDYLEKIQRLEESERHLVHDLDDISVNERSLLEKVESLEADLNRSRQREHQFLEKLRTESVTPDSKLVLLAGSLAEADSMVAGDAIALRKQLHGAENEIISLKARVAELEAKEAALMEQLGSTWCSGSDSRVAGSTAFGVTSQTNGTRIWDTDGDESLEAKLDSLDLQQQLEIASGSERILMAQLRESRYQLDSAEKRLKDLQLLHKDIESRSIQIAHDERELQNRINVVAAVEAKLHAAQAEMESLLCLYDEKQVLSVVERENFQLSAMNKDLTNKLRSAEQKMILLEERLSQVQLCEAKKAAFVPYEELSLLRSKAKLLKKSEEHLRELEQSESRLRRVVAELKAGKVTCGHDDEIKALKKQINLLASKVPTIKGPPGQVQQQQKSREKLSAFISGLHDSHTDPQEGKLSSKQQELGAVRERCLSDLMAAVKLREEKLTTSTDRALDLVQSVPMERSPAADTNCEVSSARASAEGSYDLQPTQEREPAAKDGSASDSEADIITSQNSLWERLELLQPKTRAVRSVDVVIRNGKDACGASPSAPGDKNVNKFDNKASDQVASDDDVLESADEVSEIADDVPELRKEELKRPRLQPRGMHASQAEPVLQADSSAIIAVCASSSEVALLKQTISDLEKKLRSRETELKLMRLSQLEWQKERQLTGDTFDMHLRLKEQQRKLEADECTITKLRKEMALSEKICIDRQREIIELRIQLNKHAESPCSTDHAEVSPNSDNVRKRDKSIDIAKRKSDGEANLTERKISQQTKEELTKASREFPEAEEHYAALETKYKDAASECELLSKQLEICLQEKTSLETQLDDMKKKWYKVFAHQKVATRDAAVQDMNDSWDCLQKRVAYFAKKCKDKNNVLLKLMSELSRRCSDCPHLLAAAEREVSDTEELHLVVNGQDVLSREPPTGGYAADGRDERLLSKWLTEPGDLRIAHQMSDSTKQSQINDGILNTFFSSLSPCNSVISCYDSGHAALLQTRSSDATYETNTAGIDHPSNTEGTGIVSEYVAVMDYNPALSSQSGHRKLDVPLKEGQVVRVIGPVDEHGYTIVQLVSNSRIGMVPINYLAQKSSTPISKLVQERKKQLDELTAKCSPLSIPFSGFDFVNAQKAVTSSSLFDGSLHTVRELALPSPSTLPSSCAITPSSYDALVPVGRGDLAGPLEHLSPQHDGYVWTGTNDYHQQEHTTTTVSVDRQLSPSIQDPVDDGFNIVFAESPFSDKGTLTTQSDSILRQQEHPDPPFGLRVERILQSGKLIISWKLPHMTEDNLSNGHKVMGYNVYVDGVLRLNVPRVYQHKAVVGPLDLHRDMDLSIRTLGGNGVLSPASSIIVKGLPSDSDRVDENALHSAPSSDDEDLFRKLSDGQSKLEQTRLFTAVYDYTPISGAAMVKAEQQLPLKAGDVIKVYGQVRPDGFYQAEIAGVRGLVPDYFVEEVPVRS